MKNQRLTNFFVIAFVLLMHIVIFWAVFYQQPVKIDTDMQSLNFVDLGQSFQTSHVDSVGQPAPSVPAKKTTSVPKRKNIDKSQIKPVVTPKPVESHFKTTQTPIKFKPSETTSPSKSELVQDKPIPTQSTSTQQNSNSSLSTQQSNSQSDGTKATKNGSDLVVPREYQGGFLAQLRPVYPAFSSENGEEGVVGISVSVAADGTPTRVIVSESSGYSRLDQSAKRAVQNYRFKPAMRGGVAIPYKYHFNVKFSLTK